jgi:MFS family permease
MQRRYCLWNHLAGSTMLIGLVGSFAALIVRRVILGLAEGATFPTATRALAEWFVSHERARDAAVLALPGTHETAVA